MNRFEPTTQSAIFAMQDLRELCEQGKHFVDQYCSISYVKLLKALRTSAPKKIIDYYTWRLAKAICLLGKDVSRNSFVVKNYDLDTIERLRRISEFIKSQGDPIYIKLSQRVQLLITKYNKFYNYSVDRSRFYSGFTNSFEEERIRLYNLYLDFDMELNNLRDLPTEDLISIDHLLDEEIELNSIVIQKYDEAIQEALKKDD